MKRDVTSFVQQVGKLPSLPTLYYELNRAVENPNSSISTIGDIVSKDQSLTSRLLRLANRQRRVYRAEAGLYGMYRQCPDGIGGVATALAKDGTETEAFTRLLRMDGAIERSIATTLHWLQKLQDSRGHRAGLAGLSLPAAAETQANATT